MVNIINFSNKIISWISNNHLKEEILVIRTIQLYKLRQIDANTYYIIIMDTIKKDPIISEMLEQTRFPAKRDRENTQWQLVEFAAFQNHK